MTQFQSFDVQFQNLLSKVIHHGVFQGNRTGIQTKWYPNGTVELDLSEKFPILTLRKFGPKSAFAEYQGFLRGYSNSQDFADLGCKYWHQNANEPNAGSTTSAWLDSKHRLGPNDLGEIYGRLWRFWEADDGTIIDQVKDLVEGVIRNPESRRHVVSGWKPESVKNVRGALPPCHISWKVMVDTYNKRLHLSWWQRSTDLVLGLPMNVAGYSFLLHLIAHLTGYKPGILTGHLDDIHIYENHLDGARTMIGRKPLDLPTFSFTDDVPTYNEETRVIPLEWLNKVSNEHIILSPYKTHDPIPGLTMAV